MKENSEKVQVTPDRFSASSVCKVQRNPNTGEIRGINDLFDGIAKAFRQYQAEMAE